MSETNDATRGLLHLKKALGRWDNEGGSTAGPESIDRELPASDRHLLRCLGAAVVLMWNDLPTEIQRDLFESAASMEDPRLQRELTQRLGRYLHREKGGDTRVERG